MKNMSVFEEYENEKKKDIEIGLKVKNISFTRKKDFMKIPKRKSFSKKTSINLINPLMPKNKIFLQECITKVSYRKTKDLHFKNLEYIQKEGKGLNGEKPELFGSDSLEDYIQNMDDVSWRIILSPESSQVELNTLSKEFIKKLEEQTGYKLSWIASNHYDTAKHHTHILINGKDKNGKQVQFRREMIKSLMREYSKKICTDMVGYKNLNDINRKLEEKVNINAFTQIDRLIEKHLKNGKINRNYLESDKAKIINDRLDYLIKLGLASYSKTEQKYSIKENWKEELIKYGKYNSYLEGFNYAMVTPEDYSLHDVRRDGPVKGKIIRKFIMQKDSNNFAVLIKKKNGKVNYVPLPYYPEDCHVNDEVEIKTENKKMYVNKI